VVVALRIRGGTVVTLDASRRVVVADVYVDKGRIVAIDGPEQPARRSLDATGMVVIPGMHDLHYHPRHPAAPSGLRLYPPGAETAQEVADTRAQYGMRPVELLHHLGFTGSDALLVHCVYLSAREIRSLGRAGTHIVHCPSNHMMLAKGVTPVPALLEAGGAVGPRGALGGGASREAPPGG